MKSKFFNDFKAESLNIFKELYLLLASPEQFFFELMNRKQTKEQFLKDYFYPLLGIFSLVAFVVNWIRSGLLVGIKHALVSIFPLFVTLYLSNYLFQLFAKTVLKRDLPRESCFLLIGYCLLVIMVVGIATTILPVLFFLNIFTLYVFYLLYVAYRVMYDIDIDNHFWFLLATGFSLVASPSIIGVVVKMAAGL